MYSKLTKAELIESIKAGDKVIEGQQETILALKKALGGPEYLSVEISERNFSISKRVIGTKSNYTQIAACRNRNQAERLVNLLNKGDKE